MIPESIRELVVEAIQRSGDLTPIRKEEAAAQGGVSDTSRILTDQGDYFLKWNETPWFGTFTNEAFHLSLLRETRTVHVPSVVGFAEGEDGRPAWMLLLWIDGATDESLGCRVGARLGEQLAALHLATVGVATGHGFPQLQVDGSVLLPTQDWPTFFYEAHLKHHIERARAENRWSELRNQQVDRLIERLPALIGVHHKSSLLHGDVHSCNVRCSAEGEPVLVDPWLYYGDREHEIVSTVMSGDFLPQFYEAYNAHFPLEPEYEERKDLHKLSWLLSRADSSLADPILAHYLG